MIDTSKNSQTMSRRQFFFDTAKTACGVSLFGLGLGMYSPQLRSLPALALRPPGALPEGQFASACIRCGLCVRDCPYDTLKLAQLGEEVVTGTPYFTARVIPCEMCEDIPCVKACPTGALNPELEDIDDSRMGVAALIDQESCLNFQGLRCDVCYRICPLIEEAITLDLQHNRRSGNHALFIPVVHSDACTGCGKCEHACVLPEAAIKVFPRKLARGKSAEHYRLGWEEKQKAGESLVSPDTQHEYNLPQGMQYEHAGRGLMEEESGPVPFAGDALDTLKQHQRDMQ
jgi:ferredoxin-type protein NapG